MSGRTETNQKRVQAGRRREKRQQVAEGQMPRTFAIHGVVLRINTEMQRMKHSVRCAFFSMTRSCTLANESTIHRPLPCHGVSEISQHAQGLCQQH